MALESLTETSALLSQSDVDVLPFLPRGFVLLHLLYARICPCLCVHHKVCCVTEGVAGGGVVVCSFAI